eukprot:scaffold10794_cov66-Phaeocystis_antarctica.AAC.2
MRQRPVRRWLAVGEELRGRRAGGRAAGSPFSALLAGPVTMTLILQDLGDPGPCIQPVLFRKFSQALVVLRRTKGAALAAHWRRRACWIDWTPLHSSLQLETLNSRRQSKGGASIAAARTRTRGRRLLELGGCGACFGAGETIVISESCWPNELCGCKCIRRPPAYFARTDGAGRNCGRLPAAGDWAGGVHQDVTRAPGPGNQKRKSRGAIAAPRSALARLAGRFQASVSKALSSLPPTRVSVGLNPAVPRDLTSHDPARARTACRPASAPRRACAGTASSGARTPRRTGARPAGRPSSAFCACGTPAGLPRRAPARAPVDGGGLVEVGAGRGAVVVVGVLAAVAPEDVGQAGALHRRVELRQLRVPQPLVGRAVHEDARADVDAVDGRGVRERAPLVAQAVLVRDELEHVLHPERGPLRAHHERPELLWHVGLRNPLHAHRGGRAALQVVDARCRLEEGLQRRARPHGRAALAGKVDPVGEAAVGRLVRRGRARECEHAGDHVEGEAHVAVERLVVRHEAAPVLLDAAGQGVAHRLAVVALGVGLRVHDGHRRVAVAAAEEGAPHLAEEGQVAARQEANGDRDLRGRRLRGRKAGGGRR